MKRWIGSSGSIANVKWLGLVSGLAFIMLLQGCVTHTQVRSGYGNGYGGYNSYNSPAYPMEVHRPAPVHVYSPPPRVIYYNTPALSNHRDFNPREHRQHQQREQDRREHIQSDDRQRNRESNKENKRESKREHYKEHSKDDRNESGRDNQRANLPAHTRPMLIQPPIQAPKPERSVKDPGLAKPPRQSLLQSESKDRLARP
ncbi:hypothetical protein [Thiomicrorhabdus aquaedulcis]|uniref:hypothetical protein n=1 Tax=Thiomicrorhabdus aquaedulcis TaxID=2211106 RepID=UPI000FDA9986|nr:hypothetical protein [Thiomicrorhabdus aquaedulcis]